MNSFVSITNRSFCNSHLIRKLLSERNQWIGCQMKRELRLWQEKTMKLMYKRSRSFDAVPRPLEPRSVRQEWNFRAELFAFGQRLKEQFNEDSLKTAFTHKSYIDQEMRKRQELGITDIIMNIEDNNKLAQTGQDICQLYIKAYLRHFLPRVPEDGIRAIYDYLMSEEVLSEVAKWIGCIDLVLAEDFPPKATTLAKTVKALIGALAEDHGQRKAENFVLDFILTFLVDKDLMEIWDIPTPRYNLKVILSRERMPAPEYRLLRETATGTIEACYLVGIYCDKELIGPGETVEIAKQMADLDALRKLFHLTPSQVLLKFGPKAYDLDLSQSNKETLSLSEWTINGLNVKQIEGKQSL